MTDPTLPPPAASTRDAIVAIVVGLLGGGGLVEVVRALRARSRRGALAKPEGLTPGEAQILERLAQIEGTLKAEMRAVIEQVLRDLLTARSQDPERPPTGRHAALTAEEAEHVIPPTRRR